MEKIKLIIGSIQSFFKRMNTAYRQKIQYKYFLILFLFIGAYSFIFYTGFSDTGRNDYQVYAVGEQFPATNFKYEIAGRKYNPEKKIYKVDLWLSSDYATDLYSVQAKAMSITKVDPSKILKTKVVRVDGNFISFVTYDVPENFEFLRTDITFTTDNSEDITTNEEPLEVRIYSKEKGTKIDSCTTNQAKLIDESVNYEIKKTRISIKADDEEIFSINERIRRLKRKNEKLEADSGYQLGEELENTNSIIDTNLADIQKLEERIKEKEEQVSLAKEKINMLKEKGKK